MTGKYNEEPGSRPGAPEAELREADISELHDCVYLTAEEFIFLVSGTGIENVSFILSRPVADLTEEMIHTCFFSLCSKGVMSILEDKSFQVEEPVRSMLQIIKDAPVRIIAYRGESETPVCCGYMGASAVILEISENDDNTLRLFMMDAAQMEQWLRKEGFFKEEDSMEMLLSGDGEVILRTEGSTEGSTEGPTEESTEESLPAEDQ